MVDDIIRLIEVKKFCEVCCCYGVLFIVNDWVDLAIVVDVDGVYFG